MDGHHRVYVLRERSVGVDSLPRESLEGEIPETVTEDEG